MSSISAEFAASLAKPMGYYYLFAAVANVAAAGSVFKRNIYRKSPHPQPLSLRERGVAKSLAWLIFAVGFGLIAALAFRGSPLEMPYGLKTAIDAVCTPAALSITFFASLMLLYLARGFFVKTAVAWIGFNGMVLFFGASLTDPNFFAAVMRPDDVPIVAMVFLLGFFLWLAMYQAVENDRRMFPSPIPGERPGELPSPVEKEYSEKVLVWPDLVYSELICMIALMAVLIVWSLLLPAPLEPPANPALTPNPSKAPWYFVGLQELLTYSDAWNVGVIVPALALLGLAAIPYLDRNPTGSGYYSIRGRRFAILVFLFGFLQLWILPILIGVFLRGPNWSSFGLYEFRDPSKLLALTHFSLAQAFWTNLLGRPLPQSPPNASALMHFFYFLYRDFPGASLVLLYFLALPPLAGRTIVKTFRLSLGFVRFYLTAFLLLYMLTLPIKMILFWLFGLDSLFG